MAESISRKHSSILCNPEAETESTLPESSLIPLTIEVCEKATETTASLLDYDIDSYFDEDLDSFWNQTGLEEFSEFEYDEGE